MSCSGSTIGERARSAPRPAARRGRRSRRTPTGSRAVFAACAAALRRAGASSSSSTTGASLYPEILERAGLALEQRYQRHVNRRTGRRAGEYFEDVLVARACP